ncbi:MAG: hypothetical protein WCI51_09210 [Lentisphaerota bacterium]
MIKISLLMVACFLASISFGCTGIGTYKSSIYETTPVAPAMVDKKNIPASSEPLKNDSSSVLNKSKETVKPKNNVEDDIYF